MSHKYSDAYLRLSHTPMRCFFGKHKRFIADNRQGPAYAFDTNLSILQILLKMNNE